jgi:hypothetical protein
MATVHVDIVILIYISRTGDPKLADKLLFVTLSGGAHLIFNSVIELIARPFAMAQTNHLLLLLLHVVFCPTVSVDTATRESALRYSAQTFQHSRCTGVSYFHFSTHFVMCIFRCCVPYGSFEERLSYRLSFSHFCCSISRHFQHICSIAFNVGTINWDKNTGGKCPWPEHNTIAVFSWRGWRHEERLSW